MLRASTIALLSLLAFALSAHQAGAADCEIISATHSAETKGEALLMSQALAVKSANALRQTKGWRKISMSPYKVKPDPFWKMCAPQFRRTSSGRPSSRRGPIRSASPAWW